LKDSLRELVYSLSRVLTPWVILGWGAVAILLLAITLLALNLTRQPPQLSGMTTAAVNVLPAPSLTPILEIRPPEATPTPTLSAPPSPIPGVIMIGAYVQVSGTGTDGLRLRTEPGLGGDVRLVAIESEVFQVQEGPREADGYTWWYLVGPYDENLHGWAVSNYLALVQNP